MRCLWVSETLSVLSHSCCAWRKWGCYSLYKHRLPCPAYAPSYPFCRKRCYGYWRPRTCCAWTACEWGLIKSPADLYRLTVDSITALDRKAEKSAQNLINSIEKSKHNELYRLVFALGIRNIGLKAAKLLCENFANIDDLMNAKTEDISAIEGFGLIMAESVVNYFSAESTKNLIDELKELGLEMKPSNRRKRAEFLRQNLCSYRYSADYEKKWGRQTDWAERRKNKLFRI